MRTQLPAIKHLFSVFAITAVTIIFSCRKNADSAAPETYRFGYADSILYLRSQPSDYLVSPVQQKTGTYSAFPEGLEINERTGVINVSRSETGLRYRVDFIAEDGQRFSTKVVVSGINYADQYYYLSANDTVVRPIYNADPLKPLPVTGSIFDEGYLANNSGCSMATEDGKINLASSIRQGLFGTPAKFGASVEVETRYRLNDGSNKAQNGLKVKFYLYRRKSDVPQDLLQLLNDRQGMFFRTADISKASKEALAKPRPPCIIVLAEQ